jgi:phosphatidylglycerophosphate synthase
VDPITDKFFVGTVVVTLIATGRLELWSVPLLAAREIGELPLLLWWSGSRARRRARAREPKANRVGKLATLAQFAAVALALFDGPYLTQALIAAGILGAVAAVVYWQRELAAARRVWPAERLSGDSHPATTR